MTDATTDEAAARALILPGYERKRGQHPRRVFIVEDRNTAGELTGKEHSFRSDYGALNFIREHDYVWRARGCPEAAGMPKLMALDWVEHFRAGHSNAQGNPPEEETATGRTVCRCCGQKIAKGETALRAWVKWADNNSAYNSDAAWLHLDCAPINAPRTGVGNY